MKKIRIQKGITLIALIITVILLIILAAVTIGSIKETDVIGYAQNAAEEYEEKQNEEQGKISEYKEQIKDVLGSSYVTGTATVGTIVNKNSTIDGNAPSSNNPVIPAGFKAINVTTPGHESNWDAEDGPEVNKGLVIEDEDENQFVWIPVPEIDKFARLQEESTEDYRGVLYDFYTDSTGNTEIEWHLNSTNYREPDVLTGVSLENPSGGYYDAETSNLEKVCTTDLTGDNIVNVYDFKKQVQNEFNNMVKSVEKYGGFYVGRYETSMNGANPQSKASTSENEIVSATAAEDSANTWYGLYALNKKYKTNSVESSMIWGSQYDAMMIWMGDKANMTIDEYNPNKTCGTALNDVINNIYDLYGNSREWTLEIIQHNSRVFRGDGVEGSLWPSDRSNELPTDIRDIFGSRLALYIL